MKTSGLQSLWRAGRDLIARLGVLLGAALVAGIIFQATTGVFFSVGNFASLGFPVRPGSMGKPTPGMNVSLIGDDLQEVPAGIDTSATSKQNGPEYTCGRSDTS